MKQLVPWEAVGEGRAIVTIKLDAVGRGPCMKFLQITFIDEICGRVSEYTCYTQRVREKVPSTFPCPECVQ